MRAVAFASVGVAAAKNFPTYAEWKAQYGRQNSNEDREAVYNANVENIQKLNAEGHAMFDVNEFADLTVQEWRDVRGITAANLKAAVDPEDGRADQCNFENPDANPLSAKQVSELAADGDVDWVKAGAVTPVKDQGSSGTCGYFSSITVMEGINVIQGGNKLVSLSEQETIDCCTPGNGGCNGWPGQEIAWYGKSKIMAKTEESYPYKGSSQIPKPDGTPCRASSGIETTATSAGRICLGKDDPSAILANLKTFGPAVWMIDATCLQFYSGGVLSQSSCSGNGGTWPHYNGIDHATTMVGAGTADGVAYWKVKNSWGSGWGEDGYYRVKQDAQGTSKPMLAAIGAIYGKFPSSVEV